MWFYNGVPLTNRSNIEFQELSLLITGIRTEDSGVYQCYAEGTLSANITINVFPGLLSSTNPPRINKTISQYEFQYEDPLDLMCDILSGDKPVNIAWRIDTILESGEVTGVTLHREAQDYVSGVYTCIASNEYGFDSFTIDVQVSGERA